MHYLVQATLGELQGAATSWSEDGGERYVARYQSGWAVLSGPLTANPNLPYFEIQTSSDSILDDLGFPYGLMIDELRKPGHLRGAYKASIARDDNDRRHVRNSAGDVVGVTPNSSICGTGLVASCMAGEDPEQAQEITGLD